MTRRYDTTTTITREDMRKRSVGQMNAEFKRLKPAALSRKIAALTARLETLVLTK